MPIVVKNILFWIVFWFFQSVFMSGGEYFSVYFIKNIAIVGLQIFVVYINIKFFYPLLFEKRKYILYLLVSAALIYLVFSCSFFLIDQLFQLFLDNYFAPDTPWFFSTDFWTILSGSSLYSLAFLGSTLFKLVKSNKANSKEETKEMLDTIVLKDGVKTHIVSLKEVLFIKGSKEYVVWQLEGKSIIVLGTLKNIEERYEAHGFIRIHKSYIVNVSKIVAVKSNSITINGEELPIGRVYKKNNHRLLENLNWS